MDVTRRVMTIMRADEY
ncbi:hypothetical protein [Bradyrhizobium sp. BR 1433]